MTREKNNKRTERPTGSPSTGEPVFLVVGKLRKPHGLRGEVLMEVLTDFPERLVPGKTVYLGDEYTPLTIENIRNHGKQMLVKFEILDYREDVEEMRNQFIHVQTKDSPPLPDGEYYHHQLIGLNVIDENGNLVGYIHSILETGANDVYIIRPSQGPDILLPAIRSVILEIDLNRKMIHVQIPPGLIPE